jgi:hypothetical protein
LLLQKINHKHEIFHKGHKVPLNLRRFAEAFVEESLKYDLYVLGDWWVLILSTDTMGSTDTREYLILHNYNYPW